MRVLPIALLAAAAAGLAVIALRAPAPTYVAPRAVPRQLEAAPVAGQSVRTFEVSGMCCEGCSGRLYAVALEQPGLAAAAIRVEQGRLEALCDPELDPLELARVLTFDKYTVTPLP